MDSDVAGRVLHHGHRVASLDDRAVDRNSQRTQILMQRSQQVENYLKINIFYCALDLLHGFYNHFPNHFDLVDKIDQFTQCPFS